VTAFNLSYRDRLRMTWEIVWPLLALDLAWGMLFYVLLGRTESTVDTAYHLVTFFVIGPLLVRRMLRLRYSSFRVQTLRGGRDVEAGYQEAWKAFWLLSWRSTVLMLVSLVPLSFILGKITDRPLSEYARGASGNPFVNALGLMAVDAVTTVVFVPFLIPAMIRKRYRGFRFEIRPEEPARAAAASGRSSGAASIPRAAPPPAAALKPGGKKRL